MLVKRNPFILIFFLSFVLIFNADFAFAAEAQVEVKMRPAAGDFVAKTQNVNGTAKLSGNKVSAENIKVDLRGLKTGVELRDAHTQKHLQTDKFPEAVLVKAEGEAGKGKGRIRIKGIEQDIEGTYAINGSNLQAEFEILLSKFEIKDIKYMGIGVNDLVKIKVTLPLAKAEAVTPSAQPEKAGTGNPPKAQADPKISGKTKVKTSSQEKLKTKK